MRVEWCREEREWLNELDFRLIIYIDELVRMGYWIKGDRWVKLLYGYKSFLSMSHGFQINELYRA